jgi:hypothetical protein
MKATEEYNENNIVKAENGETTKVETTKVENKGKYVAASLAGLVTSGGFMAFALREEDTTGDVAGGGGDTSADDSGVETAGKSGFEQAFAAARAVQGKGGVFKYEDNYYGTYYKDEWDALSKEEKEQFYASVNSKIQENAANAEETANVEDATNATDTAENGLLPEETAGAQVEVIRMASQVTDEMSPETAFVVAREEVGPGHIYEYKGEIHSTYTADELLKLSPEEIERMRYIMEQVNLSAQTLTTEDVQGEETILDPQTLVADTEITDTETIANTPDADTVTDAIADTETETVTDTDTVADVDADTVADVDAVADTTGEQIDYHEDENEGEERIDTQETESNEEIEYVVKVKLPLLSSSDDDDDDSLVLESSDDDTGDDTDFDNPINDLNNDMNLADNL